MTKKLFILSLFTISVFVLPSCSSDGVDCDDQQEITSLFNQATSAYTSALTTFSLDETKENCEALKSATEQLIDDLEPLKTCATGADRTEFENVISEARAELSAISCG